MNTNDGPIQGMNMFLHLYIECQKNFNMSIKISIQL